MPPGARRAPGDPGRSSVTRFVSRRGVNPRRWRLLTWVTLAYGAGAFGVLGVSPLAPLLLGAFQLTRFEVGLLLPAVYVGGLIVSLPAGRLADRFGVRLCLMGGLALAGVMLGVAATVPVFTMLLGCLVVAGIGWSIVNPALGRAIIELFPGPERGIAMGIKQMGLTLGGIAAAVALPGFAVAFGWRAALLLCAAGALLPVPLGWRATGTLARPLAGGEDRPGRASSSSSAWWWLGHPPLLVFFAAGLVFGVAQSAVLGYLAVYATQALDMTSVGAGGLLAVAQAGGATARLVLGVASDRFGGERVPWLVATCAVSAAAFALLAWPPSNSTAVAVAVAFALGVGTLGWVGLYLVLSAEIGGHAQAGLLTGVAMAVIFGGILFGAPLFGALLEATDSYAVAWGSFAGLSVLLAAALWLGREAIQGERQ